MIIVYLSKYVSYTSRTQDMGQRLLFKRLGLVKGLFSHIGKTEIVI